MTKTDFHKLNDLDKLEYALKESSKEFNSLLHNPYHRGSHDMIQNILKAIQKIKDNKQIKP